MIIATDSILCWSPVTFLEDLIHCWWFCHMNYKNSFLIHLEIPEITEDHFQGHPIFLPNKLNRLVAIVLLELRPFFFLNLSFGSVSLLKCFIKNSTLILPNMVLSYFMTTKLLNYILLFSLSLKKTCISEIKTLNQNTQKVRGRKEWRSTRSPPANYKNNHFYMKWW